MKKISFLMLLLLMFSFAIPVHASELDIQNLKVEIEGTNKSIVDLSFEVDSTLPVQIQEIAFYSDMDGATTEIAYDWTRSNEKVQVISNGVEQENGHYLYHFVIESQSGKIGTFKIRIKYYDVVTDKVITQAIHVTNGNPNVARNVFTPVNALIIGFSATIASVIATFIIIKLSEKNVQLSDEEE